MTAQDVALIVGVVLLLMAVAGRWADRWDREHADAWQRNHPGR